MTFELPPSYNSPIILRLGSNTFGNVQIPIAVDGFPVLLVGMGSVPRIWLSAPTGPSTTKRRYLVDDNRSNAPSVIVSLDLKEGTTTVQLGAQTIVSAKRVANELVVDRMDLRPLGLDVRVKDDVLSVGSSTFVGNSLHSMAIGIALNGALPPTPTR